MTDRDVQDEIIRYLTEPLGRTSASLALAPEQAARAAHFAQFLARRYYRDRLGRSFRYSAMMLNGVGRRVTDVVEGEEFNRVVSDRVMGSLAAAQQIGALAVITADRGKWRHRQAGGVAATLPEKLLRDMSSALNHVASALRRKSRAFGGLPAKAGSYRRSTALRALLYFPLSCASLCTATHSIGELNDHPHDALRVAMLIPVKVPDRVGDDFVRTEMTRTGDLASREVDVRARELLLFGGFRCCKSMRPAERLRRRRDFNTFDSSAKASRCGSLWNA